MIHIFGLIPEKLALQLPEILLNEPYKSQVIEFIKEIYKHPPPPMAM